MRYDFEDYSLDTDRLELRRGAERVAMEPQVLDLLLYLVRNRQRVVSKDDLIAHVWNGRVVSDSTLSSRVTTARKAVGDNGKRQRLIRTVSRRGLRFVGEVRQTETHTADQSLELLLGRTPQLPDKPSIAVLAFTNLSGDPAQDYFSDGITEDIITALSRIRWIFVIARNTTFSYKDESVDVRRVGRDLGVRYVLEGSVQKSGGRVRITAQLVDTATGKHLWAERHDRELTDIFAMQDEITTSVAAAIEPTLVAAESMRAEARSVDDLDAWDLVARAVTRFWKLSPSDSATSIAVLQEAVKRYPDYAPPHSLLAFAMLVAGHMGWRPAAADKEIAERLALRAAELDDNDPWAHMALGYLAFATRRTDAAVNHFVSAIELNPNFAAAYGYAGWTQAHDGRSAEAVANLGYAVRISPRDPFNVFYMAGFAAASYVAGQYSEAVRWARRALQLRPGHLGARRKLVASLAQAGLIEEAQSELQRLRQLQPDLSIAWIEQSVPYTSAPMKHFLEGMRKAGLGD